MLTPARLAAALTTSGLILQATAAGPWAFAPATLLWAVPPLIAIRSLPLFAAAPIVLFTSSLGRFAACHDPTTAALAALALLPVLLLDRFATTWLPRVGVLMFPAALPLLNRVVDDTSLDGVFAPLPDLAVLRFVASDLGTAGAVVVAAGFAGVLAAMGSILNRHIPDPFGPEARDMGARWASVVALILGILLLLTTAARLYLQGEPTPPYAAGDVVAALCGLVVVVVTGFALASWRRQRERELAATR